MNFPWPWCRGKGRLAWFTTYSASSGETACVAMCSTFHSFHRKSYRTDIIIRKVGGASTRLGWRHVLGDDEANQTQEQEQGNTEQVRPTQRPAAVREQAGPKG